MTEDYRIISQARGEPRVAGQVGVCVRVQLSGSPSPRWSRNLGGRLTSELVGHAAIGHLRININDLVQGDQIVLDGVEADEAPALAEALRRAVDGANRVDTEEADRAPNVPQGDADDIAHQISLNDAKDLEVPRAGSDSPCPQCGEAVPMTATNLDTCDQLAVARIDCPSCAAALVRDVDGHADRGWRLAEDPGL